MTVSLAKSRMMPVLIIASAVVFLAVAFMGTPGMAFKGIALLIIGLALGITLYHASFGFTGAYRRFIVERDMSGITAQIIMLALAIILFAPLLHEGSVFGQRIGGAVAPIGVAMVLGAFVFGLGMQIAGGCASGTLFTAGGGSMRMVIVLIAFCGGAFVGSLHLSWWLSLPQFPAIALGREWGWGVAVFVQLAVLVCIYIVFRRLGGRNGEGLWRAKTGSERIWAKGPWPLIVAAIILAGLNAATLMVAGHPWSVTWGYTLWGAKAAMLLGWDPATSSFWSGGFQQRAIERSIIHDTVSILNIGIVLGAAIAATVAGRLRPSLRIPLMSVVSAVIGGLLLGYGARLAYGCNIGAFFSGVASSSLHGWVWIIAAAAGNVAGVRVTVRASRFFTGR